MLASRWGGMRRWPLATLVMLWPTFGGHYVELFYLEWLRPRLPSSRSVQLIARLATWFIAGVAIGFAMRMTADALLGWPRIRWPDWWLMGFAFIGIELIAHVFLQFRNRPSFYNARG